MFKSAVVASLLAGASAFAPAQQSASSTALSASFENELGVQAPLGLFGKFDLQRPRVDRHGLFGDTAVIVAILCSRYHFCLE
jgi:hypothetical protein